MAYEHLAMAVAYADAKGLPYETKSKQEIKELGGVSDNLILPYSFSGSFPDFIERPIGTWSDDTQHTLAMMRSISKSKSFNLPYLVSELKEEYLKSDAGWGGASKKAMEYFVPEMKTESLRNMGVESTGCGPLMRLAPLAIYQAFHTSEYDADIEVMDATTCTHKSNLAVAVSQALASVVRGLVKSEVTDVVSSAIGSAMRYEVINNVDNIFSERLKKVYSSDDISASVYEINLDSGASDAFAIWSVATVALAAFNRYRSNGFKTLIDAVIAEGGDTDSSAAIAAGLYMAQFPDYCVDFDDVNLLIRNDELRDVGNDFSRLVSFD